MAGIPGLSHAAYTEKTRGYFRRPVSDLGYFLQLDGSSKVWPGRNA